MPSCGLVRPTPCPSCVLAQFALTTCVTLPARAVDKKATKPELLKEYNIPPTSLKRHKKAWLQFRAENGKNVNPRRYFLDIKKTGAEPRLSKDEEGLVAAYLKALAEVTAAKDKGRTLALLSRVAKAVGCKNVKGSHTWFKAFLSRSEVMNNDGTVGQLTKWVRSLRWMSTMKVARRRARRRTNT